MADEKIALIFEAQNAGQFNKAVKDSELALRQQARALDAAAREMQKEVLALKAAGAPNRALIADKQRLVQQTKLQSAAIRANIAAMREEAVAAAKASTAVDKLEASLKSSIIQQAAATASFVAMGAAISSSIKAFGDFERSLNTIKAVSSATANDIKQIADSSKELGAKTVFSTQEVANSYVNLAKAGFTAQESLKVMPGLLDLAAAAGGDLAGSAEIAAGTLKGFNLGAEESSRVADVLAQAANRSAADIEDLGFGMKQLAPVAATANQTLEESGALLSALANRMIKGADAGSDLRAILVRLIDPPKDAATALNTLGISVTDSQGKIKPFIDIVIELQKSLAKFDQKSQNKIIADIAALENLKSLSALVNTSAEELLSLRAAMQNASGAAEDMADTINQGVNTAVEQFMGSLENLGIVLGQELAANFVDVTNRATDFLNTIAQDEDIKSIVRELGDLLKSLVDVNFAFLDLAGSIGKLPGVAFSVIASLKYIANGIDLVSSAAQACASIVNGLVSAISALAHADINGAISAIQQAGADVQDVGYEFQRRQIERFGGYDPTTQYTGPLLTGNAENRRIKPRSGESFDNYLNRLNTETERQAKANANKKPPPSAIGTGGSGAGKKPKGKKGPSAESLDRARISDINEQFQSRIQEARALSDLKIANLGPFPNEGDILGTKLKTEQNVAGILSQQLLRLNNTTVKTKDGQKELQQAIAKVKVELIQSASATKDAGNALIKFNADEKSKDFQRSQELKLASIEQVRDRDVAASEEVTKNLQEEYSKRKLSIDEYYAGVQRQLKDELQAEEVASAARIKLLEAEIQVADQLNDQNRVKDLKNDIEAELRKLEDAQDSIKKKQDEATRQQQVDTQAAAEQFGQTLQQAIADALTDVFTGNNPLKAIVDFGKKLKDIIGGFLAQAIAEGFKNSALFQNISAAFGNIFNKLSGRSSSGAAGGSGGIAGLLSGLKKIATPQALIGTALVVGGNALAGGSKSGLKAGGGALLSAGGGALAGAAIGSIIPGIGTALGAIVGGLGGGGLAVNRNASKGGFFSSKGGGALGGALAGAAAGALLGSILPGIGTLVGAGVGALVGGVTGLFSGGSKAKQAKRQKDLEDTQAFIDSVLGGVDSNNLNSLIQARSAINQYNSGPGDSVRARRAASIQLTKAIADRQKALAQAVKELQAQNEEISLSILEIGDKTGATISQRYQLELKKIEVETQSLLEQYSDSEEAKTKILEQQTLKRSLLLKQEQDDARKQVEDLADLLKQRDEIANSNVFTRRKSNEQLKADQIAALDPEIAQRMAELQATINAGISPLETKGLNQILGQLQQIAPVSANLQVVINGANDPNAVNEQITRAFESFYKKIYGANAA